MKLTKLGPDPVTCSHAIFMSSLTDVNGSIRELEIQQCGMTGMHPALANWK